MVDYLSELANTEEELIVYILLSGNSPCLTRVNKRFREIYVRNENRLIVRHIEPAFTEYKLFGKCHRGNDLPAIVYADRTQMWYQHGKIHRDNNLPAVIHNDGYQAWYRHGKAYKN